MMIRKSKLVFALLLVGIQVSAQNYGTLTDPRDGKKYRTIKVGNLELMAENLNFDKAGICYDLENLFCRDNGRLYSYKEVVNSENSICPPGWHIPTSGEWKYIITKLNGKITNVGAGITEVNLGTNTLNFTFSGYGNGVREGFVSFLSLSEMGFYASSSTMIVQLGNKEWEEWNSVRFEKYFENDEGKKSPYKYTYFLFGTSLKNFLSCRCMKDS
jgi:uncharacterized protein (TIGR02145 family)